MPPKVDWPMVHGADNKTAIMSTDVLQNTLPGFMMRLPSAWRVSDARAAVDGKYKTARKKVVSKFTKEQLGQMRLLDRRGNSYSQDCCAKWLFFLCYYERLLMNSLRITQDFLTH